MPELPPKPLEKDTYQRNFKLIKFGLGLFVEINVIGLDNIPDAPSLIVSNHEKIIDSLIISADMTERTGRPVRYVAQQEYFDGEGIRRGDKRVFGKPLQRFVTNTHMISADRSGSMEGMRRLTREANEAWDRGDDVGVHPEATRADNGKLNKFYAAIFRIAMDAGVPILTSGINYHEPTKKRHYIAADLAYGVPITEDTYEHGLMMALPKSRRVNYFTAVAEHDVALLAGLEQSHRYMQDIRSERLTQAESN